MFPAFVQKFTILPVIMLLLFSGAVSQTIKPATAYAQSDIIGSVVEGGKKGLGSCVAEWGIGKGTDIVKNLLGGELDGILDDISSISGGAGQEVPVRDQVARGRLKSTVGELGNIKKVNKAINEKNATENSVEHCFDVIFYHIARQTLNDISDKALKWVQSGFTRFNEDGQTGFVQNIEDYKNKVRDQAFKQYVNDVVSGRVSEANQICPEFAGDVLKKAGQSYWQGRDSAIGDFSPIDFTDSLVSEAGGDCKLSDYLDGSPQNFLSGGDFSSGGWEAFAVTIADQGSNPISSYLTHQKNIKQNVSAERSEAGQEVAQGDGFLPQKACPKGWSETDDGRCTASSSVIDKQIITPGQTTGETTQRNLESDINELELADEKDEVISQLAGLLIDQIFKGSDGTGLANAKPEETTFKPPEPPEGEDPAGFIQKELYDQITIEEDLVSALNYMMDYADPGYLDQLQVELNQCVSDGKLAADEVENRMQELRDLRDSIIESGENEQEEDEDREVGPQKVNWLGDDFGWKEGKLYGLGGDCSQFAQAYDMTYKPVPEDNNWQVLACVPQGGGEFNETSDEFKGTTVPLDDAVSSNIPGLIPANPPLYRGPRNNKVKVDWNGRKAGESNKISADGWKRYNPFAEDFVRFISEYKPDENDEGGEIIYRWYDNGGAFSGPGSQKYGMAEHSGGLLLNGGKERMDLPGPNPGDTEMEKFDQVRSVSRRDINRYKGQACNPTNRNAPSWIIKPGEDVWTQQICQEISRGFGNRTAFRFVDQTDQNGNPVTKPAFQSTSLQADGLADLRKNALKLLWDDSSSKGSGDDIKPGRARTPDNVPNPDGFDVDHRPNDSRDGLYALADRFQKANQKLQQGEDNDNQDTIDEAKHEIKQITDEFNALRSDFHSRTNVDRIMGVRDDYQSTLADLKSWANDNNCTLSDPDGSGGDDEDGSDTPRIDSFQAFRIPGDNSGGNSGDIQISWNAAVDRCEAESNPPNSGWSGSVGSDGTTNICTPDSISLELTCFDQDTDESVTKSRRVSQLELNTEDPDGACGDSNGDDDDDDGGGGGDDDPSDGRDGDGSEQEQ
jgi:hypothetical protein